MSNSYERNIRKYEMFVNDKQYINKLISEVRNGRKNSNKAIVEAYNRANVDCMCSVVGSTKDLKPASFK